MVKHYTIFAIVFLFVSTSLNAQIINEFASANNSYKNIKGKTYDWIEIYNNTDTDIDLKDYSLTDDSINSKKWMFPSITLHSKQYLLVWASGKNVPLPNGELQTNFKIKSRGEALYLFSPENKLLDKAPAVDLNTDYSYGRATTGFDSWYYFETPTPKKANTSVALTECASPPDCLTKSGYYSEDIVIKFSTENIHDTIYYTLNGSVPTKNSEIYTNGFTLDKSAVVRAKAFREGAAPSKTITNTYFINNETMLGVVSLVTDNSNFWGNNGIYSNPNSGQEASVHIEYFTEDKILAFSQDVGVKIHSPDGRRQKSLRLYARDEYGKSKIKYQIFPDKDINVFKRLVIRNGGNDGLEKGKTQIRDIFTHKLYQMQNEENAISSFKFVNVYINGKYWGIYNLRERQDKYYMKSNFGFEEDEVDFLEYDYLEPGYKKTVCGNWKDWEKLKKFLNNNDMTLENNYKIVENWIDIDNFIDYQIFEIFIGNQDWENNNIKFWRPKNEGGKWKWILWDTDYALGTQRQYPVGKPEHNFIHMALSYGGWGSGDYTWMLRNLMKNDKFKRQFIVRYQDLLNSTFLTQFTTSLFDSLANEIEPELSKQFAKWGKSKSGWDNDIDYATNFLERRPEYCRLNLANEFGIPSEMYNVEIDISKQNHGLIKLNTLDINDKTLGWDKIYPWKGVYFAKQELSLVAIPKNGYEFDHWEGDIIEHDAYKKNIKINLDRNIILKAIFKKEPVTLPKLYVNEIMAANETAIADSDGDYGDWVEIYNPTEDTIDMKGLYMTDDLSMPDKFRIPENLSGITKIEPKGYLVFFADEKDSDDNYLHLNFKFKKGGEAVGIYFKDLDEYIFIDTVTFPELKKDKSFGRLPDGGEEWVIFPISTPKKRNKLIYPDNVNEQIAANNLSVWPNPAYDNINVKYKCINTSSTFDLIIMDVKGKTILHKSILGDNTLKIDISANKPGVYFVKIVDNSGKKTIVKKIIKIN